MFCIFIKVKTVDRRGEENVLGSVGKRSSLSLGKLSHPFRHSKITITFIYFVFFIANDTPNLHFYNSSALPHFSKL